MLDRKQVEEQIHDKLLEIRGIAMNYSGFNDNPLCLCVSKDHVNAFQSQDDTNDYTIRIYEWLGDEPF